MDEQAGREQLKELVIAARKRRYRSVDEARVAADISRASWDKVEKALPVSDNTLDAVDKALRWPVGRSLSIIGGNDIGESAPAETSDLRQSVVDSTEPAHIKAAILALLDAGRSERRGSA